MFIKKDVFLDSIQLCTCSSAWIEHGTPNAGVGGSNPLRYVMRPYKVQCILYQRVSGIQFLMLRRNGAKGNFWQAVTGRMEDEDSDIEATALREIGEETGISEQDILHKTTAIYSFQFVEQRPPKDEMVTEYVFGIEVKPNTNVVLGKIPYQEHSEYRWVGFEEALKLIKYDTNKEALRRLYNILEKSI